MPPPPLRRRLERSLPALRRPALVALLACAALASGAAAPAQAIEWDQENATKLATEFEAALGALLDDPGASPEQDSAMAQRRHDAAISSVESARRLAKRLVGTLRQGEDQRATTALWDQIVERIDEAEGLAEDSWMTASARAKAERARERMDELAKFYQSP